MTLEPRGDVPADVPQPWVCAACGNSCPGSGRPPEVCPICADERQWVPPDGQQWTTLEALRVAGHRSELREVEPGLTGIGVQPQFAIGQRALLVSTPEGNLLWDPPRLRRRRGDPAGG